MKGFTILPFIASIVGPGLSQACTSEQDTTGGGSSSTASVGPSTGSGASACSGNLPDGVCTLLAAAGDTCDCPDCAQTAGCTGKCMDDGTCNLAGGEDCTCKDCYGKVMDCMFGMGTTTTSSSTSSGAGGTGGSSTGSGNGGAGGSSTTTATGGAGGI